MKISRIKEIKNIGTFAKFENGGSFGFEKLTFIYGLNTYGKTTLADIFQSLKLHNPSLIINRKTIPEIAISQKAEVSAKETDDGSEKIIKFENSNWIDNTIANDLEVFGTDFIHNNVFTGLLIERKNRENFTNFILGDQGVKLAESIKEKKKVLGDKKRDLRNYTPVFVKNFTNKEIEEFVNYDISKLNKDDLDSELIRSKSLLQKEKDRLKEPTKITNMDEPKSFGSIDVDYMDIINTINNLLDKDYQEIKKESIDMLDKHISNNFSDVDGAKNWIQRGLKYCLDKEKGKCPFCSQNLNNVKDLIDLYDSYFDKAYTDFIDEVVTGLDININTLKNRNLNNYSVVQSALLKANLYKDLIITKEYQSYLQKLISNLSHLKEDELQEEKFRIVESFENKISSKIKIPYEKIEKLDPSDFKKNLDEYKINLEECRDIVDSILTAIKEFKKQYSNVVSIIDAIKGLESDIQDLEFKKARFEQNDECVAYKKLISEIEKLETGEEGIKNLEEKLQKDQTDFLSDYFGKINNLFVKFGSKNFTLIKEEDSSGHLPVYSLKVQFHNKPISNDKLCNVFSESDRRALALSIFFAKLELKDKQEQNKTVIILDDPITSFDDNRTTNSINYFKEVLGKSSQMIILTHYTHFIKRFCEITKKDSITTKFLKIEQNEYSSYLENITREELIINDYEKIFMKIYNFINKKTSENIKADLRPFLENLYFPTIFSKKIHDDNVDCSNLETIIDGLFSDYEEVKNKFHEFRNTLNPDSHLFTSNNIEDVRNFAKEMFEYIYSLSIVGSRK
ncbi:MAG: AAA family ATPase [Patescibacteria group bacterium]|jgi:wobble nucleotide-excising tRNase|nr:AAA family ATPase [Patescibacteria group bacterium]